METGRLRQIIRGANASFRFNFLARLSLILTVLCLFWTPANAGPFDDPRVREWSASAQSGNIAGAFEAVSADLLGDAPHPAAAYVWTRLAIALGKTNADGVPEADGKLAEVLGARPQAFLAFIQDRPEQVLALFSEPESLDDPWLIWTIAFAAYDLSRPALAARGAVALLKQAPDTFEPVWLINTLSGNDVLRAKLLSALGTPPDDAPLSYKLAAEILAPGFTGNAEDAALAAQWLKFHPTDARALRFQGHIHRISGRDAAALKSYEAANRAFPFYPNGTQEALVLIRTQAFEKARLAIENEASTFSPPGLVRKVYAAAKFGAALMDSGEYGRSRTVLDAGLAASPNNPALLHQRVRLARKAWGAVSAKTVALEKSAAWLALDPANPTAVLHRMHILRRNGEPDAAIALWEKHLANDGETAPSNFGAADSAYHAAKRYTEMAALAAPLALRHPGAAWLHNNIARALLNAGNAGEAKAYLLQSAGQFAPISYRLGLLKQAMEALGQADAYPTQVAALLKRWPQTEAVIAAFLKTASSESITAYRARIAADPALLIVTALAEGNAVRFSKQPSSLRQGMAAVATVLQRNDLGAGARAELRYLRGRLGARLEQRTQGRAGVIDSSITDLAAAEAAGAGSRTVIAQSRYQGLLAAKRLDAAAAALMKLEAVAPDSSPYPYFEMLQSDASGRIGSARAFIALTRFAARRPRNNARQATLAKFHLQWGGGPLNTIQVVERLRAIDPTYNIDWMVKSAYGRLGMHKEHFLASSTNKRRVGRSERYVGWWKSDRKNAWKASAAAKRIDIEALTAVTIRPDGMEVERRWHPVTGQLIYRRIGAASAIYNFDEEGRLVDIQSNDKPVFKIAYGGKGVGAKIARIDTRSDVFRFEYAAAGKAAGKPTRITVDGVGALIVTYDESGEIDSVESEEGGVALSIKVSSAMSLIQRFQRSSTDVSDMPLDDPAADTLQSALEATEFASTAWAKQMLALVTHYVANIRDHASYGDSAIGLAGEIVDIAMESEQLELRIAGLQAVDLWRRAQSLLRPEGIPVDAWETWSRWLEWTRSEALAPGVAPEFAAAAAILERNLGAAPLLFRPERRWLAQSDLSNPGLWARYDVADILPRPLRREGRINNVVVRENGHVVLATSVGLAVLRRGFWEWFAFDAKKGRFDQAGDAANVGAENDFTHVIEDGDGVLWLAGRLGLVAIAADYAGEARTWRTAEDGLPGGQARAIAALSEGVVVGGKDGLAYFRADTAAPVKTIALPGETIGRLRAFPFDHGQSTSAQYLLLAGTRQALFAIVDDAAKAIGDGQYDDAWFDRDEGVLWTLRGEKVRRARWDGIGDPGAFLPPPGVEEIRHSGKLYGFAEIDDGPGGARLLGILTDSGVSIWRERHFEHLTLPGFDGPQPIIALASLRGRAFMVTPVGVAAMEAGQAVRDHAPVYDLLSDRALGVTFVARGGQIDVIRHEQPRAGARRFSSVNARRLARAPDGALITHDDLDILRFGPGETTATVLFQAEQTVPHRKWKGPVVDILAAQDGAVWVAAGPSIFRHKDGETTEYSTFKDVDAFPNPSSFAARVIELADGRIWAIQSDESHLTYSGMRFIGGAFEWTGEGFKPAPEFGENGRQGEWFVRSYTALDDGTALLGTSGPFIRHRGTSVSSLTASDGPASYKDMDARRPQIMLGARGARMGKDIWLFGTGAGVIARANGAWFYPERLNQMLPDQHLSQYGARSTNAVATDAAGHVYVGGDRGLLVYDPIGAGPETFLIANGRAASVFDAKEQEKLRGAAAPLLAGLDPKSKPGRMVKRLKRTRKDAEKLRAILDTSAEAQAPGAAEKRAALRKKLIAREKAEASLLARLERDNPSLYHMLKLDPLDLRAIGRDLGDGVVVVQYLPTEKALYINLVTRERSALKKIAVPAETVFDYVDYVSAGLADKTAALKTDSNGRPKKDMIEALAWLYDHLLRPIEGELAGAKQVLIAPTGLLNYLPFPALVRSIQPDGSPEYAVSSMTIGYVPTIYFLDVLRRTAPSIADGALVMGDSDGSLPRAREESELVAAALDDTLPIVRIGEDATYDELLLNVENAKILHLAVHGKLNAAEPEKSWLQLAGGHRLDMTEAMLLPLAETELVFLSACETGIGRDGLEFRTLAHAFAHAGAPAVIATLWKVNDGAAKTLATKFYTGLGDGGSLLASLADAQRAMITGGGWSAHPAAWAPFVMFGREPL